jgi:AAA domain
MHGQPPRTPTVIVIGGVPGAGKSSAARRLAADLSLPFLSPDTVGQTLRASRGIRARDAVDAYWIAYDVLFRLCEEFVGAGLSVVLELNLGWAFQWDWLDRLAARQPAYVCCRSCCAARDTSVSSASVSGTRVIRPPVPLSCTRLTRRSSLCSLFWSNSSARTLSRSTPVAQQTRSIPRSDRRLPRRRDPSRKNTGGCRARDGMRSSAVRAAQCVPNCPNLIESIRSASRLPS